MKVTRVIESVVLGGTLLALAAVTTPAYAQLHRSPAASNGAAVASDVFKVQYFDTETQTTGANSASVGGDGDGLVRIINPTSTPILCAMEYVFDSNEEEQECCGCIVTTDGLRVQTVDRDLTSNPSNGVDVDDGIVKIISSLPNSPATGTPYPVCNPALAPSLSPALRPSITHTESSGTVLSVSAQSFDDAPLDQTELNNLVATCAFIHVNQSGRGICHCGRGDNAPATAHAGR